MSIGEKIQIQSYKHNELLHRIWEEATIIDESEDMLIVANHRTKVIESNGRFWHTKEPSISWFYKHRWFNVIGIIKRSGIHYYCNIASPYVRDEEALKYIDYDLDVKVIDDFSYTTLDRNEYNRHKERMDYPKELKTFKEMIEKKEGPFSHQLVMDYYHQFQTINPYE